MRILYVIYKNMINMVVHLWTVIYNMNINIVLVVLKHNYLVLITINNNVTDVTLYILDIFFVHSLIMYGFSTTHFIVIFIAMCNIINVNCYIELIY